MILLSPRYKSDTFRPDSLCTRVFEVVAVFFFFFSISLSLSESKTSLVTRIFAAGRGRARNIEHLEHENRKQRVYCDKINGIHPVNGPLYADPCGARAAGGHVLCRRPLPPAPNIVLYYCCSRFSVFQSHFAGTTRQRRFCFVRRLYI